MSEATDKKEGITIVVPYLMAHFIERKKGDDCLTRCQVSHDQEPNLGPDQTLLRSVPLIARDMELFPDGTPLKPGDEAFVTFCASYNLDDSQYLLDKLQEVFVEIFLAGYNCALDQSEEPEEAG